ncbi:ATP-binding protein [Salaquimonas pukyongi]|uniref:ATP-binding protein n=1 Tax=Salaquimonas pukyongi TaxID=2712698 RepID=UPI00096B8A6E|nr:ATP-binding protein [Salaquimonas pukyongi]
MSTAEFTLKNSEKLGNRLSWAAGLIIFTSVVLTSGTFTWLEFRREFDQQVSVLRDTAVVFGSTVSEPLAKGDRRQVQQALTSISRLESFRFAEVLDRNGDAFAEMGFDTLLERRSGELPQGDFSGFLISDDVWVSDDVIHGGQEVGTVRLLADISNVRSAFFFNIGYNLLLSLLLALLATAASRIVIRHLTLPIFNLSQLMTRLGRESDYTARASEAGKGEIRLLAQSFNRMLEDIETRNRQLMEYQETLEARVEERTRDLAEAKEEADRANAAKSEFLATMSHEIRTPMNSMLVSSELLASAGLDARHQRYADIIARSGRSLLAIINDILDLSKIQAGKLDLEKIPVSTHGLVKDALDLFFKPASDKGLDICGQVDANVPEEVIGDPTRLHQILTNLTNNALKFTEKGAVTISVKGEQTKEGAFLRFAVTDTGIGIPPQNAAQIFDSFSQADQTTTRKFGGTGLGLAICRQLVEAMGGKIGVDSKEGEGSSFHFTLPVAALAALPVKDSAAGEKPAMVILPPTASRRVIVDGLRRVGHTVTAVSPGDVTERDIQHAELIYTLPALITELPSLPPDATLVAIGALEDAMMEKLVAAGTVQDAILLPVSTPQILQTATRVAQGKALGAELYRSKPEASHHTAYSDARVLLVDDNAVNREVALLALSRFAIEPVVADNGFDAIKLASDNEFDLIFMDCSMPEMDGFEATRRIRQQESDAGTAPAPIVALTAHKAETIETRADAAGMDAIMVKPFTIGDLTDCLSNWLEKQAWHGQGTESGDLAADEGTSAQTPEETSPVLQDGVFDPAMLQNLRDIAGDGFEVMLQQLRALYKVNASGLYAELSHAVEHDKAGEIGRLAHALKSMSFNIGAGRLGAICQNLEDAALGNAAAEQTMTAMFADISREYDLVMFELDKISNGSGSKKQEAASAAG